MGAVVKECHPFRSPEARERYLARYDERAKSFPAPSETRVVPTSEGETLVRVTGPEDAQPVVLLQGKWGDSLMWPACVIEGLSERHRLFTVDNPFDLGRSVSAGGKGDAACYVSWMDGLLDGLGLTDGVSIVGLSLGAWIAGEYALRAPHRLAKVVWLSPGGMISPAISARTFGGIPLFFACASRPSKESVGKLMAWLMPYAVADEGALRRGFDSYVEEVAFGLACFAPLPAPLETNRRFGDDELRGFGVPLLYIAGEHDRFVSAERAVERLTSLVPAVETEVVPDIAHELILAHPEAVTNRVLAFLDA